MIANLHGTMALSPQLLKAYTELGKLFSSTSFNAEELTVVWQTINVEHNCHYCVPAHTAIANMMKVDAKITAPLREQKPMPTDKLQALHNITLSVIRKRGMISDEEITEFFDAGYAQQQLLEIILGVSQKVISNYVNHIAHTPVDTMFEKFAWQK